MIFIDINEELIPTVLRNWDFVITFYNDTIVSQYFVVWYSLQGLYSLQERDRI